MNSLTSICVLIVSLCLNLNSCQPIKSSQSFEGKRISNVEFRYQGPRTVDEVRLKNFIKVVSGDLYATESIDEDIKSLYGSGLVNDVRALVEPRDEELRLIYAVQTSQLFGPCPSFIGNTVFSDKRLALATEIKAGVPLTEDQMNEASRKLEQLYQNHGYPDAKVLHRFHDGPDRPQDCIFVIEEGHRKN